MSLNEIIFSLSLLVLSVTFFQAAGTVQRARTVKDALRLRPLLIILAASAGLSQFWNPNPPASGEVVFIQVLRWALFSLGAGWLWRAFDLPVLDRGRAGELWRSYWRSGGGRLSSVGFALWGLSGLLKLVQVWRVEATGDAGAAYPLHVTAFIIFYFALVFIVFAAVSFAGVEFRFMPRILRSAAED